jgi:hypothetical protein
MKTTIEYRASHELLAAMISQDELRLWHLTSIDEDWAREAARLLFVQIELYRKALSEGS